MADKPRCEHCKMITMQLMAADKMAAAIDVLVRKGLLDARSLPADARLDYGQPWQEDEARTVLAGDYAPQPTDEGNTDG